MNITNPGSTIGAPRNRSKYLHRQYIISLNPKNKNRNYFESIWSSSASVHFWWTLKNQGSSEGHGGCGFGSWFSPFTSTETNGTKWLWWGLDQDNVIGGARTVESSYFEIVISYCHWLKNNILLIHDAEEGTNQQHLLNSLISIFI